MAGHSIAVSEEHKVRVADGYAVVPTASTLRMIRRPAERATAIREVRRSLLAQLENVEAAMDDTAIELSDRHRVTWDAIGRRFGMRGNSIHRRAQLRRAVLAAREAATAALMAVTTR